MNEELLNDITVVPHDKIVRYEKTNEIKMKSTNGNYAYVVRELESDLIRCKECKHRAEADYINTDTRKSGKYQTCLIHGGEFTPDDYCSYGERENNETD